MGLLDIFLRSIAAASQVRHGRAALGRQAHRGL